MDLIIEKIYLKLGGKSWNLPLFYYLIAMKTLSYFHENISREAFLMNLPVNIRTY